MSNRKSRGVKLKPRIKHPEEVEDSKTSAPPKDIYESVVATMGFDPLKEMAARRT